MSCCTTASMASRPESGTATIEVTCRSTSGAPFPAGDYILSLAANYSAAASCAAGRMLPSTAPVVVAAAPKIVVTAQSAPARTCAGGKVVAKYQYTVAGGLAGGSGLELVPSASSSPASTCIIEKQGAHVQAPDPLALACAGSLTRVCCCCCVAAEAANTTSGTITASCSGAQLVPGTMATITLQLAARQQGCLPGNGNASVAVSIACCARGTGYAKLLQGPSKCLKHLKPGTQINECRKATHNQGWFNRGPGQAALYIQTSNTSCTAAQAVGNVSMACDASGRTMSFALSGIAESVSASRMLLVKCADPASTVMRCPSADMRWRAISADSFKSLRTVVQDTPAGRVAFTTFDVQLADPSTVLRSCDCSSIWWSLLDTGAYMLGGSC